MHPSEDIEFSKSDRSAEKISKMVEFSKFNILRRMHLFCLKLSGYSSGL
jgi:hypothetical protein